MTIVAWISGLANPGPAGVGDHQAGEMVGFPLTQAHQTGPSLRIQAMSSTFPDAPALQEAFALIERGHFSGGERDLFRPRAGSTTCGSIAGAGRRCPS
jgi:hypothetical protein